MPASFTLTTDRFPAGTVVGLYAKRTMIDERGPKGAVLDTATTSANLTTAFTGLAYDTEYWGAADLGGSWRKVSFRTEVDPALIAASQGDFTALQAEAAAAVATEATARANAVTALDTRTDSLESTQVTQALDIAAARRYFPVPAGGNDSPELESRINAGEKDIALRSGTYTLNANIANLAGKSGVAIRGVSEEATAVIFNTTTGKVFDMTASSFCTFSDMLIRPSAQKTAGSIFSLDHGAGTCQRNRFERLRIGNGFVNFELDDCTTTEINGVAFIDHNAAWGVSALIALIGQTTSTRIDNIVGGTAAEVASALVSITGSTVDTVQGNNWDLLNLGGTGCPCLLVSAGRLIKLGTISLEAGTTADAVTVSGGHAITLSGIHLLGRVGVVINAGTGVTLNGGDIMNCHQNAVTIGGGAHHVINGMDLFDLSQSATATYPGIYVAAGAGDFTITNNVIGPNVVAATQPTYGIRVETGGSDRYVITGNRCRNFATAGVSDGGTGVNKSVANNISVA